MEKMENSFKPIQGLYNLDYGLFRSIGRMFYFLLRRLRDSKQESEKDRQREREREKSFKKMFRQRIKIIINLIILIEIIIKTAIVMKKIPSDFLSNSLNRMKKLDSSQNSFQLAIRFNVFRFISLFSMKVFRLQPIIKKQI